VNKGLGIFISGWILRSAGKGRALARDADFPSERGETHTRDTLLEERPGKPRETE